jgi:hypothetical protein
MSKWNWITAKKNERGGKRKQLKKGRKLQDWHSWVCEDTWICRKIKEFIESRNSFIIEIVEIIQRQTNMIDYDAKYCYWKVTFIF